MIKTLPRGINRQYQLGHKVFRKGEAIEIRNCVVDKCLLNPMVFIYLPTFSMTKVWNGVEIVITRVKCLEKTRKRLFAVIHHYRINVFKKGMPFFHAVICLTSNVIAAQ